MNDGSQRSIPAYLDFDLEIGPGNCRAYPVLARSAAGEARETLHFPFDELALENQLLTLQNALLRSGGRRRQTLSPEQQAVQAFGKALFDALFVGEVRSAYHLAQREAASQDKGLRLRLRIQPSELAALPWEFLFDPRAAEYICLSANTPVVRYIELPQPVQPLTIAPPLRILGMTASPAGLEPLDMAREKERVERAVKSLRDRGLVALRWLEGQTWRHLQRAMRDGPWHIFHFIGHGGFDPNADEGLVALADDAGRPHYLPATQLGRLLADHRSLRLALLNTCEGARGSDRDIFSSTAAILVRRGIPAVVAMQYEISDGAAVEFAQTFYESLADAFPVEAAVTEARKAISIGVANSMEWGTPMLYSRAADGLLISLQAKPGERDGVVPDSLSTLAEPLPAKTAVPIAVEVRPSPTMRVSAEIISEPTIARQALTFTVVGNMKVGRAHHYSALLSNGNILIAGGISYDGTPPQEVLSTGEIFDPVSRSFVGKTRMLARRYFSAMTSLADNTILVTGGVGENGEALDSAEIYNPTTGNFYPVGRMTTARRGHNAVLLKNGRVLIAGGDNAVGVRLASGEIFDPIERTFSITGEMNEARLTEHTPNAVVLQDGRVLIAGGYGTSGQLASVEVYDPDREVFVLLGNMALRRACQSLTVLKDGKDVLIAGGYADGAGHLDSAEIYSPDSHNTKLISKMNAPHFHHTATRLIDGKVLIVGGYSPSIELYDPDTRTFKEIGCLTTSRYLHTTILLSGCEVLVIGGADHSGRSLASVEGSTIP